MPIAGTRCCTPPAAKHSKRCRCSSPFRSGTTNRPPAPIIPKAALATACARSRNSSRPTWAWRWPSPTWAAGIITSTRWARALRRANWPRDLPTLARRWPPSGWTWATAGRTSPWSPCRSSAAPRAKTATAAPITATRLADFGQALAAFWLDLGDRRQDVALVTMSEFGRTARENGDRGTDHGHANCMFLMGGGVRGGKVYGKWPGLEPEQLYEARDLALTTDFRDVLGELVRGQMGNRDLSKVFPGYAPRVRGILRDA